MNYTLRNLMIAAVLGIVGIVLTTSYIKAQKAELSRGKQEVKVWVAKKDIPAGTQASALEDGGYLEEGEMLREDAPPQTVHNIKDVKKLSLNETIFAGEVLTAHKFETTSGLNPTEQIKGTERLISVPIPPSGAVAGLVKPGDHVDIIASANGQSAVTWVVARDVLVLQTPTSLLPKGSEVDPVAMKAGDDPQLYVFQISDKVVQDTLWSEASSGDSGLRMSIRPSDAAQDTKLRPQATFPDAN